MEIETYQKNGVLIIKPLERRLDEGSVLPLKQKLRLLIQQGFNKLLINMEKVDAVDSPIIGALVSGLRSLEGRGEIGLCNLNKNVEYVINLSRLNNIFTIFRTEADSFIQN